MKQGVPALAFALILGATLSGSVSFAKLGGAESTVTDDTSHFAAHRNVAVVNKGVAMHELVTSKVSVKEYVADGKVFAVSWRGRKHADIQTLLGSYYDEFSTAVAADAAQKKSLKGRHPRRFKTAHMVYESGGTMGHVYGIAYVQSLMPATVSANDIH